MRTILLVEDEQLLREIVTEYFVREGFEVLEAENGIIALEMFKSHKVDLILLDIMIPGIDGWGVCQKLRETSDVPIIMITARSEEDDKLLGYELGADEYVTKPFSPKVLVAQAKALLKRTEGSVGMEDGHIRAGAIEVAPASREVWVGGDLLVLSPKEYDLLLFFVEHKNTCLTRELILEHVWGFDYAGDLRTVDTHIKKLRNKLGASASMLVTVIRMGYKLEVKK